MSRGELAQLFLIVLAGLALIFAFRSSGTIGPQILTGGLHLASDAPSPPRAGRPRETSTTPLSHRATSEA
jgi:hypothetical protein